MLDLGGSIRNGRKLLSARAQPEEMRQISNGVGRPAPHRVHTLLRLRYELRPAVGDQRRRRNFVMAPCVVHGLCSRTAAHRANGARRRRFQPRFDAAYSNSNTLIATIDLS